MPPNMKMHGLDAIYSTEGDPGREGVKKSLVYVIYERPFILLFLKLTTP